MSSPGNPLAKPPLDEDRIQTLCLLILSAVAIGFVLHWLRGVMIPFVLALFIAIALGPVVSLQRRWLRFPHWLAVLDAMILALLLLGAIAALVSASAAELLQNADTYQAKVRALAERMILGLELERFGIDPRTEMQQMTSTVIGTIGRVLVGATNAILDVISQGLLVLIFVVYLLIAQTSDPRDRSDTWRQIHSQVHRYLATKIAASAITGLLVGVILGVLGIDLALVFGLMAALLNFIPNLGSIVATILPVPVVLMSPDVSAPTAVLAIALPTAVQFTIGNGIEPRITGGSLDLHPITVLLSLIVWGMLWGVVGMLLAAPITAVMRILFARLDHTAPLAELLAGHMRRK